MLSTPPFASLATRLAAPARLLAIRLGRGISLRRKAEGEVLAFTGPLESRLHVPILERSAEAELWAGRIADYAGLASAGAWDRLFADLRQADLARTVAPGGRSLAALISAGGRAALVVALTRQDWSAALREIELLAEVQEARADDPMAACLLAEAHLDYAAARRKAEPGPGIPREVWQDVVQHTAMAEAALEPFDPIEEDSPQVAGARYLLVRGIEDGAVQCRDWYEDWSDLDPANPEPHLTHAVHLLPKWFGTLSGFDAEARQAMRRTRPRTGAAAYALFQMAAAESLGDLPQALDIPLYLAGLNDHFRATGCQHRANIVGAALSRLDHDIAHSVLPSQHGGLVRAALGKHLRHCLRNLHLSAWGPGEAGFHYALSQVFAEELARGAHIYSGPEGLVARLPG